MHPKDIFNHEPGIAIRDRYLAYNHQIGNLYLFTCIDNNKHPEMVGKSMMVVAKHIIGENLFEVISSNCELWKPGNIYYIDSCFDVEILMENKEQT